MSNDLWLDVPTRKVHCAADGVQVCSQKPAGKKPLDIVSEEEFAKVDSHRRCDMCVRKLIRIRPPSEVRGITRSLKTSEALDQMLKDPHILAHPEWKYALDTLAMLTTRLEAVDPDDFSSIYLRPGSKHHGLFTVLRNARVRMGR